ncbi:MAG: sensor histidine kinase [Parashewanella sp.]
MKSLFSRLWLAVTITVVLLFVFLWQWLEYNQVYTQQRVQQSLHSELAEHMAHINPLLAQGVTANSALKEAFHDFMLLGPSFEIYTLDIQGQVVAFYANKDQIKNYQVDTTKINGFLNQQQMPILGSDPRNPEQNKIFSVAKLVNADGKHTGYLYVIIGGQRFDAWQSMINKHQIPSKLGVAFGLMIIASLIMLTFIIRYFTRPLSKLAIDLTNVDVSNLSQGLQLSNEYHGSKEVDQLNQDINLLLTKISHQHRALEAVQKTKHDFLVHLSHDLKTPLTSLLGYIETWLITPKAERNDEWIDIANRSGNRLKSLLMQLLELAALENGQIKPNIQNVALNSLLSELLQDFTPLAEKKNITLDFEQGEDTKISTDVDLMMRVLSNLIDNAIRHTPASGKVAIKLQQKQQHFVIYVSDTGLGINIQQVKSLKSQPSGKVNFTQLPQLGVGLTIVKRLIELMNYKLHVEATPKKGSRFSILIPITYNKGNPEMKQA